MTKDEIKKAFDICGDAQTNYKKKEAKQRLEEIRNKNEN